MKLRKLLVLSALWLAGLGANAANLNEREAPYEPEFFSFDDVELINKTAADFIVGDCYVLYNKGAAKYYYQGNAWGTQATGSIDQAMIVRFVMPSGKTLDDKQLYLRNYVPSKSNWMTAFVTFDGKVTGVYGDGVPALFVDNNDGSAALLWVEGVGNKTYRISISESNTNAQPEGCYMGIDPNGPGVEGGEDGTCILPKLSPETEGVCLDWELYPVPEWTSYFKELDIFNMSEKLKELIETAEAARVDVSAAVAVYNDPSATVEQMEKAMDDLRVLMANALSGASEENPLDATFMLKNANFDSGNVDGWDITYTANSNEATNIGYQNNSTYTNGDVVLSGFIEAWKNTNTPNYLGDGSITQTVRSLPAGKYMLGVDVIANNQGRKSVDGNPDGLPDDVELFATASADGKTYKTNMATRNGAPEHFEFNFIHTGGDMTMGLRVVGSAEAEMPANWIAMDNLTLTYFGEVKEDPDKVLMDMAVQEALKAYPLEDLDDVVAYVGDKDAFKAAIEEAQAATEGYLELMEKVQAAQKQLDASVAAYKTFAKKQEDWMTKAVSFNFDNDAWAEFCDFADSGASAEGYPELLPLEVLEQMSLTIEEINAYIAQVDALFKKAFAGSLEEGSDVTMLLTNADLMEGRTGWTTSSTGGNFQPGGFDLYKVFEAWHATNFNFSQTISDLPIGVYELSTQGYVRYLDGQEAISRAEERPANIPIYIYMNDSKANLPNWLDYPQESGFFDNFNTQITENGWTANPSTATYLADSEGKEYPDNMTGAAAAFYNNSYTVRTYGLVANEGETFTVGIKGDVSEAQYWPLWGQFKLIYRGFNAEVIAEALDAALPMIDTSKPMAKSLFDKASEMQAAAQEAKASADGEKMFAILKEIYQLTEDINESVALFAKLQTAAEDLITVANESGSALKNEALTLADEIQMAIDGRTIENADAEEYLVKIAGMKTKLRLPDVSGASDEAPVNVTAIIETPGFEKDGTNSIYGWTATGQKFGNSDQLSALALESWESVFNIYQDIIGLPDGIYTLKVNGWERTATPTYLYAESGDQAFSKELIKQEEGLPEGVTAPSTLIDARNMFSDEVFMNELIVKAVGEKLRIGVRKDETSSADWIVIDEFQLWYHGANSSLTPDPDNATGVEGIAAGTTVKVEYFTLDGRKANSLQKGIMIQKVTFENGTVMVKKIRK
ncbi:MAG: hypothetical protein K6D37_05250 [Prevotella sp.]|nr:hypothetical protein [Prevotella sp.]